MAISVGDIIKSKFKKIASLTRQNTKLQIKSQNFANGLEQKIYKVLEIEPLEIDEIAVKIRGSVVEIGSTLSIMGIKGLVTESGGKYYLNR